MDRSLETLLPVLLMSRGDSLWSTICGILVLLFPIIYQRLRSLRKYKTITYLSGNGFDAYYVVSKYVNENHIHDISAISITPRSGFAFNDNVTVYIMFKNYKLSLTGKVTENKYGFNREVSVRGSKEGVDTFHKIISEMVTNFQRKPMLEKLSATACDMDRREICEVELNLPMNAKTFYPKEIDDELFNALDRFMELETVYVTNGIPYKYSLLLEGIPGTGKTSLSMVLAAKYNMGLKIINEHVNLTSQYHGMIKNKVILLDDIDLYVDFNRKDDEKCSDKGKTSKRKTTFGDILSFLDGRHEMHKCIVILTTNAIDKVKKADPALFRGGRIDRKYTFSYCTESHLRKILMEFYEIDVIPVELDEKIKKISQWKLTISDIMTTHLVPSLYESSDKMKNMITAVNEIFIDPNFRARGN